MPLSRPRPAPAVEGRSGGAPGDAAAPALRPGRSRAGLIGAVVLAGMVALPHLDGPAPGLLSGLVASATGGVDVVRGPYAAQVVKVVDGDTLRVRARIWLGMDLEISVRLAGIDTPELRGRCEAEKRLAHAARGALVQLVGTGPVQLHDVHYGKYAGRIVARVTAADGRDLAAVLRGLGLARDYAGGGRDGWCVPPAG